MESKKKKKIAIIVSLVSVFLIVAVLGTFFAIKAINNNKNNRDSASHVNNEMTIEDKLFEANKAIINKQVSADYNGTYTFKTVSSIIFNSNLTAEQITTICTNEETTDPNGLQNKLLEAKRAEATANNEVIVLKIKQGYGSYTKTHNKNTVVEYGKYYGNNDLSEIKVYDETKNEFISEYDMSLTRIKEGTINTTTSSDNTNNNLLYIYKYARNKSGIVLFTITYVYELVPPPPIIPDTELDFEI